MCLSKSKFIFFGMARKDISICVKPYRESWKNNYISKTRLSWGILFSVLL